MLAVLGRRLRLAVRSGLVCELVVVGAAAQDAKSSKHTDDLAENETVSLEL